MLKAVGLLLIILACTLTGIFAARRFVKRTKLLYTLAMGIKELSKQIEISGKELSVLLPMVFGECELLIIDGNRLILPENILLKEDYDTACEYFSSLGTLDKSGECDRAELYSELLFERYRISKSEEEKNRKIYITIGICTGLGIAVLLI